MQIECPKCAHCHDYSINEMLGNWVICDRCRLVFPWQQYQKQMEYSKESSEGSHYPAWYQNL